MRKSQFAEAQIIGLHQQAGARQKINDVRRWHRIHGETFYRWRRK